MTSRDIETMLHFITRTEMFIIEDEEGRIISFVHGYEIGRNDKCDFSNQISEMLEKEFNCKNVGLGWNGQISEFAKKKNLTWEAGFKKIGVKVLSKYFQVKAKKKYEKILKLSIESNLDYIGTNWFREKWINNWTGLVALEEKWFREIWTNRELKIISNINTEVAKIEVKNQEKIIASKDLIKLMKEFKMN